MRTLSVVIPVFNAEHTIGDLGRELVALLGRAYQLQLVLVDDCSSDGSARACRALAEEFPGQVTYARLSRNFGEHNAVMAGLNLARGEAVVVMDDDFQNPPEEVPKLLEELARGRDVVYCRYPGKRDSWLRNLASYLNGTMARVALDKPGNLYLSSFKAMSRFLVSELVANKTPHPYLDALVLRATRNIGTVEVRHASRRRGRSGYSFRKLTALWGNMIVGYSLIPLRLMSLSGLLLALLGTFSILQMLVSDLHPRLTAFTDLEQLTAVSTFFRGLQLLATGTVGEYIGRIYLKLDQEPQYIVRELVEAPRGGAPRASQDGST